MAKEKVRTPSFEYDVALSFAGEDRSFVQEVAERLIDREVRVFYDEFFADQLWGKDLFQDLQTIYRDRAALLRGLCIEIIRCQGMAKARIETGSGASIIF